MERLRKNKLRTCVARPVPARPEHLPRELSFAERVFLERRHVGFPAIGALRQVGRCQATVLQSRHTHHAGTDVYTFY